MSWSGERLGLLFLGAALDCLAVDRCGVSLLVRGLGKCEIRVWSELPGEIHTPLLVENRADW